MKNAQGLPMNVIIMAAIALLVMIVLLAIFSGKTQIVSQESGCIQRGGECILTSQPCNYVRTGYSCQQGKVCCMNPAKIS